MIPEKEINSLIALWQKRNIKGVFCKDRKEALVKVLEIIPQDKTAGLSGSVTLDELKVVESLEARGNLVFNQYKPDISREESINLRAQGVDADYYLSSANAITKNGELIFFSAYSHRIVGISSAKNVVIVSGVNKIVEDLDKGFQRVRDYVIPLNCKRLNWPSNKEISCQILIIEAEIKPDRLTVILTEESLGY